MASKGTCKAENCDKEVQAKGYCPRHYSAWRKGKMPKPRYKTCTFEKCRKPRVRGSRLVNIKNYHIGDYNLFYMNIRENVKQRVQAYFTHSEK